MRVLSGKVAIVTGAGNGIGRAEAVALAAHGSAVVVNDLGGSVDGSSGGGSVAADAVVAMIRARGGRAIANYSDVSDWEQGARMVQQAVEEFGGLDILVNNAGINRRVRVSEASEDDVDALTRVLFRGTFSLLRHAARYWCDEHDAGSRRPRAVVNTSSSAGVPGGVEEFSLYGSMKAAIAALTMTAALELRPFGISVNAICPHAASRMDSSAKHLDHRESDLTGDYLPDDPRYVSDLVSWLVSGEARYVSGQVFEVGGGMLRKLKPWSEGAQIEHAVEGDIEQLGRLIASQILGTLPSGRIVPVAH
jgi:NAD(P)-dependent dehydrogenase (short-subunit alcohol dehydrogenase family)